MKLKPLTLAYFIDDDVKDIDTIDSKFKSILAVSAKSPDWSTIEIVDHSREIKQ